MNVKNGTYFAEDGNYGEASGIVIVNTEAWTDDDWNEIEEASDHLRAKVAAAINAKHSLT